MYEYGKSTDCLRGRILRYFGEKGKERCENCSNCLSNHVKRDVTVDVQKLLSCIRRSGEIYGGAVVISVLRGITSPKIKEAGLEIVKEVKSYLECVLEDSDEGPTEGLHKENFQGKEEQQNRIIQAVLGEFFP